MVDVAPCPNPGSLPPAAGAVVGVAAAFAVAGFADEKKDDALGMAVADGAEVVLVSGGFATAAPVAVLPSAFVDEGKRDDDAFGANPEVGGFDAAAAPRGGGLAVDPSAGFVWKAPPAGFF